jgi:hypothetical protein
MEAQTEEFFSFVLVSLVCYVLNSVRNTPGKEVFVKNSTKAETKVQES